MEVIAKKNVQNVMQKLDDIVVEIKWAHIAEHYFGKSSSWMYNKLKGIDGNGGVGGFTPQETEELKNALCDFSERVRRAAMNL